MRLHRREVLLGLGGLFLAGSQPAGARASARSNFPVELKARIKAISNVFEVGKADPDYAYVADLKDGRGYTVTSYGFTTDGDEVTRVIKAYRKQVPDSDLIKFLAKLPPVAKGRDTIALEGFAKAWIAGCHAGDGLPKACESLADRLYFNPSLRAARDFGIKTPIGVAIIYDTMLEHGDGDDPDSLRAIYQRTRELTAGAGAEERDFLYALLEMRRWVLENPSTQATAKAWRESVPRIDALQQLLAANPQLATPVRVVNREVDILIS